MTRDPSDQAADVAKALVILAECNIPTDIQELLVRGDTMLGIAPNALGKAIRCSCSERDGYKAGFNLKSAEVADLLQKFTSAVNGWKQCAAILEKTTESLRSMMEILNAAKFQPDPERALQWYEASKALRMAQAYNHPKTKGNTP